uniref:carbohydrate ABC transporter permease n=1 Tax=Listeria monocytogenes TaxID=1639 RepID=UPI00320485FF
ITNVVAVAVVWSYLYNPRFGLLNYLLSFLDLGPVPWLQDPTIAKLSLIILAVWRAIGVNMIIFLAALQGIPREYYEAASLDGACLLCYVLTIATGEVQGALTKITKIIDRYSSISSLITLDNQTEDFIRRVLVSLPVGVTEEKKNEIVSHLERKGLRVVETEKI